MPDIVCNLTDSPITCFLQSQALRLLPGPNRHLTDSQLAFLNEQGWFQKLRDDGYVTVVNREAKVPWHRMSERVQRERTRAVLAAQRAERAQQVVAEFDEAKRASLAQINRAYANETVARRAADARRTLEAAESAEPQARSDT